jgi:hypothetical protein
MVPGIAEHEVQAFELRRREMLLTASQRPRVIKTRSRTTRSTNERFSVLKWTRWFPFRHATS